MSPDEIAHEGYSDTTHEYRYCIINLMGQVDLVFDAGLLDTVKDKTVQVFSSFEKVGL
jgi:hypothetical protein